MQPQSSSPNPQYDFIMNSGQPAPPSHRFSAPKLPKLVLIIIGGVVLIILLIIIASILGSAGKESSKPYLDLMSRSAEIVRVGELAKPDMKDPDTLALLTTTNTALSSQQSQLGSYLAGIGTKVDPKQLTSYLNSETDKGLQSAIQNNNLEEAYAIYLKGSLDAYLSVLKSLGGGSDVASKQILAEAVASTEALLSAPQFTN